MAFFMASLLKVLHRFLSIPNFTWCQSSHKYRNYRVSYRKFMLIHLTMTLLIMTKYKTSHHTT